MTAFGRDRGVLRQERDGTTTWNAWVTLGRVQAHVRIYRHTYPLHLSERWVLDPRLVYDRKREDTA